MNLLVLLLSGILLAQGPVADPGPKVGARIPAFTLLDQTGQARDWRSLCGPKGLMLVFTRSADWCPYCKSQLIELEARRPELEKQGLRIASITYDTPAILKHFGDRKKIGFPMLSDADSVTIRAFGVLNESVPKGTPFYGIPHPVTFVVDSEGVVTRKYAEPDYRERQSLSGVLVRDFGVASAEARTERQAKHVQITASASTGMVVSGERIALVLDVDIPAGHHVYAPGVDGYIPVAWNMAETAPAKVKPVDYPKSKILFIQAIDEKVPVYEGRLHLVRDVTIADDKTLKAALSDGTALTLESTFKYQACSDTLCYPPETVPVRWTLQVQPHDRERVPAELRKAGGVN